MSGLIRRFAERRRSMEERGAEGPWLLVFDIDSTLMDTEARNRAILEAAFAEMAELAPWKPKIDWRGIGWNVLGPLEAAGFTDERLRARVRAFWQERFFTDEWTLLDRPYPAAADCLRKLKDAAFRLVYLTGRHSPGMEKGTRESFRVHGLPEAEERFFFKPSFDEDDLAFKTAACAEIGRLGTVVGTLDNEPANVNLFARAFPDALNLHLRTISSPAAVPLAPGIETADPTDFHC